MTKRNIPNLQPREFEQVFFGKLKPAVFGNDTRFHITKIQEYKKIMSLPVLPHRRSVFYFLYVTQGVAVRSRNLNTYEVKANQFYSIPAFQITTIESMSSDIEGFYCHFEPEIFNQVQLDVNIQRDFPFLSVLSEPLLKINNPERIIQMLELIYGEYSQNQLQKEKVIALQLTTLLSEVNYEFTDQPTPRNSAFMITEKYKYFIADNISQVKRISDCANALGVSANHLNKCVKETTGKSAHQILVDMRVLQAKVMLKQSDLPIKEIAISVGAFESSDFAKFFKKSTGYRPLEYRNRLV